MSKYLLVSSLVLIVLVAACSDSGDKTTDPVIVVSMSVGDYTVVEGGTALFPVTLDRVINHQVTFSYATIAGSATAGADFTAAAGSDTIPAGETSSAVVVATLEDSDLESTETLLLALSAVAGAEVTDALATGTINDNETGIVSFASNVKPILLENCAKLGFCHASTIPGGGMYIDAAVTYAVVMNATGIFTGGKVVVPGNASQSSLYFVTTEDPPAPFGQMPSKFGDTVLTTVQQNFLRDWINQGALDN